MALSSWKRLTVVYNHGYYNIDSSYRDNSSSGKFVSKGRLGIGNSWKTRTNLAIAQCNSPK